LNNNTSLRAIIARSGVHAGIDKLVLTTHEYRVSDTKPLNILPLAKFAGQEAASEGSLLFKCQGEPVHGAKAFVNTENYQANISQYGLSVIFNPSKILHPYELLSEPETLRAVCMDIEKQLQANAIHTSLENMKVSRLDIAKQAQMPRKVSHYKPAFEAMQLKGAPNGKVTHGTETFRNGNRTLQTCFYDKFKELNPKGLPSDFMRAEVRMLNTSGVKRHAGINTLGQVIQAGREGWNFAYTRYLNAKLFTEQPQQLGFDFAGLDTLISALYNHNPNGKGHIGVALETIGVNIVFEQIGPDRFLQAFAPYCDSSTLRRARARLFERAYFAKYLDKPISTLELINELKTTFAHEAA
jgi:hypothetical protein